MNLTFVRTIAIALADHIAFAAPSLAAASAAPSLAAASAVIPTMVAGNLVGT